MEIGVKEAPSKKDDLKIALAEGKGWRADPKVESQLNAIRGLVGIAVDKHKENMVNTDEKSSRSPHDHRYESYYKLPSRDDVLILMRSLGVPRQIPDKEQTAAFWIEIYQGNEGEMQQAVRLQMPKNSSLVDYSDAVFLSTYTPEQLTKIRGLVMDAEPVSAHYYQSHRFSS